MRNLAGLSQVIANAAKLQRFQDQLWLATAPDECAELSVNQVRSSLKGRSVTYAKDTGSICDRSACIEGVPEKMKVQKVCTREAVKRRLKLKFSVQADRIIFRFHLRRQDI